MSESSTKNLVSNEISEISNKVKFKKKRITSHPVFLILFFTAILFGSYKIWKFIVFSNTHIETDNAYITGHIVPVNAKIGGHVEDILVEDNQWVNEGDVLVKLEKQDLNVKLNQATANLETARQDLAAAKSAYELQKKLSEIDIEQSKRVLTQYKSKRLQVEQTQLQSESEVNSLKAQINSAISDLRAAESQDKQTQHDYKRIKSLFEQGAINGQTLEDSKTKVDISHSRLVSANQKIKQLQEMLKSSQEKINVVEQAKVQSSQDVGISEGNLEKAMANANNVKLKYEQLKAQEARVKQAEVALFDANLKLSYTIIKSPVSGLISKKSIETGQTISENQSILSIIPLKDKKDLWIIANLKETQLKNLKIGEQVEVKVDAYPDLKIKGKVDSLGGGTGSVFSLLPPDNATGNFTKVVQRIPVKIVFTDWNSNLASLLRPGLSTTVSIYTGK